jgi:integrase
MPLASAPLFRSEIWVGSAAHESSQVSATPLSKPTGKLLALPVSDIIPAQPKRRRKGRKSMLRRSGQNGTIVVQSGFYRVRWRIDVEGQQERINMTAKVAPVSLDKEGKPKPPSPEVRRRAREIVEQSGANSKQHFDRVVLGEITFRKQAEVYLRWAKTRDREPVKDTSSIEAALNKWILPEIGDLSLGSVNNITVKPLVDQMKKAKLSAKTVNEYVKYVKQIVASLRDGETGEPIHNRKWNNIVMDLPVVNRKQQKRPSLKANAITQLVQESEGQEQALYVLLSATGMRISEALAIEEKHFTNGGRTIEVRQQVHRKKPVIVTYLKTDAAFRDVDLHPDVAEFLQKFIDGKDGLLFTTREGTPYLHHNIEERWLTARLKVMGLEQPGMGWHAFRRFRETRLRGERCQPDINVFWMGHEPATMSELYSHLFEETEMRLVEVERVGVGFQIISYCAPKCSKKSVEVEVEVAA